MTTVTFTISNLRKANTKTVYALFDADLEIDGLEIRVLGIQARHLAGGGTSLHLPTYRDVDGTWRAAVALPVEVCDALSDAALEFLIAEGVSAPRHVATAEAE